MTETTTRTSRAPDDAVRLRMDPQPSRTHRPDRDGVQPTIAVSAAGDADGCGAGDRNYRPAEADDNDIARNW
jgi:hypothetical protein